MSRISSLTVHKPHYTSSLTVRASQPNPVAVKRALAGHISQGVGGRPVDIPPPTELAPAPFGRNDDAWPHGIRHHRAEATPAAAILDDHHLARPDPTLGCIGRMNFQEGLAFPLQQARLASQAAADEVMCRPGKQSQGTRRVPPASVVRPFYKSAW